MSWNRRLDYDRLRAVWPLCRHAGEAALLLGMPRNTVLHAATRLGLPKARPGRPRVPCVLRSAAREGCRCAECRRLVREKRRRHRQRWRQRVR